MAYTLDDYLGEAHRLTKDDAKILKFSDDYKAALLPALRDYAARNPLDQVLDVPGTDGDIAVSSLTGFEEEFSEVRSIEYPISSASEKPRLLPRSSWMYYRAPAGLVIRFLGVVVPAGSQARFTYTARHTLTRETNTVPDSDFVMLSKFIAAECCIQLSRHYTQSSERTVLQADVAFYVNKGKEWAQRAAELRKEALNPPSRFIFA